MSSSRSELDLPSAALAGFADNAAHLRAELEWVHQVIRSAIHDFGRGDAGPDEFAGVYISREEIDRYLQDAGVEMGGHTPDPEGRALRDAVTRARTALDRRNRLALARGIDLRLERLARAFLLEAPARAALLCVVAAELDPQIARLFSYLQNDAAKKRPTFALLTRLTGRGADDPVDVRRLFGPASPLMADRLVEGAAEGADTPLPAREARPAVGLVEFLVGIDTLPAVLTHAEILTRAEVPESFGYHRHHRTIVEALLRQCEAGAPLPFSYVAGPGGSGKQLIAEALASALRKDVIRVHWARLRGAGSALEEAGRVLRREARMRNCLVLLDGADAALTEPDADRAKPSPLETFLVHLSGVEVMATGTVPAADVRHRLGLRTLGFELPYPTCGEREEIWRHHLADSDGTAMAAEIPLIAAKFRFTPGQIAHAVHAAQASTPLDADGARRLNSADLHARCREEAQRGLHLYCQKIVPRFDWADIVLPADTRAQLGEICRWVRHRSQVYDAWGFGAKQAVGRGVTVLFSGASGTGKTMSAEVIAADLQLDLFRVDLSRIVSKYIGETEKNLSRVFEQAAISSCVLFFDEADALFGKRTEVKDAHDRYANIEINYLLSEMDQYEGIIILSTNLKGNLDSAFIRRFSHVVEYPVPNERLRETIWRKAFPADTPLDADVDFGFLAQRFNLAGGNIKNIVLTGAFLAATDARPLGMEHLILATKREYQKIGRLCSKSDFGQYYGLVREADVS